MTTSRFNICGTLLFALTACGADVSDQATESSIATDSAGVSIVTNVRPIWADTVLVTPDPLVEVGRTPGVDYELFGVTDAVRLSDGRIVVSNGGTSELRWYSSQGTFLMSAGGTGDGPGEFQIIARVVRLPGDSLMVVDARLRRYSILSADGEFVRTVRVEGRPDAPLPIARFLDGTILMAPGTALALGARGFPRIERIPLDVLAYTEGSAEPELLVTLRGLELSIGPSGGTAPDGSMPMGQRPRPFGRNTFVAGDPTGWVAGDNDEPRFEIRDPSGVVVASVQWPHQPRPVTPDDVESDRAPTLQRLTDPVARNRMLEAWSQHPEPPETMPAFGSILLDELGNVWVREYSPSFEPVSNRFQVFDRSGAWLGSVVAPVGIRVMAVGDGWILGIRRDELDVEAIMLHEFEAPWS